MLDLIREKPILYNLPLTAFYYFVFKYMTTDLNCSNTLKYFIIHLIINVYVRLYLKTPYMCSMCSV